jgi:hypothetical protein
MKPRITRNTRSASRTGHRAEIVQSPIAQLVASRILTSLLTIYRQPNCRDGVATIHGEKGL